MPIEFLTKPSVDLKRYFLEYLRLGIVDYTTKGWLKFEVQVTGSKPEFPAGYPAIEIRRVSDVEQFPNIGDFIGDYKDDEMDEYIDAHGTQLSETIQFIVHTQNTDQRDFLYNVTKSLLFDMRDDLADKGIAEQRIRGLGDQEDESLPGQRFWLAIIEFSGINQLIKYSKVDVIEGIEVEVKLIEESEGDC